MATSSGRIEQLDTAASMELLASRPVGRIAFISDGAPMILPVNHVVDGWSILFRSASGTKLAGVTDAQPMAFEADGYDPITQTGWSVVARGVPEVVWSNEIECYRERTEPIPWPDCVEGDDWWLRLSPTTITGRRISRTTQVISQSFLE
jgi:uncharacterized protein